MQFLIKFYVFVRKSKFVEEITQYNLMSYRNNLDSCNVLQKKYLNLKIKFFSKNLHLLDCYETNTNKYMKKSFANVV